MNQLSNLNAMLVKEVRYDASLLPAFRLHFTVENCHTNAYIEQIVFTFDTADASFADQTTISIFDRGHAYPSQINGVLPVTYASFGAGQTTVGGTLISPVLTQKSTTSAVAYIGQSIQDSEGIGNFYIQLDRDAPFVVSFTMAVFYRPENTYNMYLKDRNQVSNDYRARVLAQTGVGTYLYSAFTDVTHDVANRVNHRNNLDTVDYGFTVFSTSPIFYFGTPFPTRRWFLGFAADNQQNISGVTFSHFDGTNFVGIDTYYNAAQGPGTYPFANDGVVIFDPGAVWKPVQMPNDPATLYNQRMVGLGTLATNDLVPNPAMYWVSCRVGFATTTSIRVSAVVPLIDPDLDLTYRRRLI